MSSFINALMGAAGSSGPKTYVEDVFSTYLYTGTGSSQTITNGIDLSTKGGMVWCKCRSTAANHAIFDTARGANKFLISNDTAAQVNTSSPSNFGSLTTFNTDGFTLGQDGGYGYTNFNGYGNYAAWTFRKQAKFFDIVTYTGDGTGTKLINHNLGVAPGFIIIKRTDTTGDWLTAAALTGSGFTELLLNSAAASYGAATRSSYATSSVIKVGDSQWSAPGNATNILNATYVAYVFADSNSGGFGDLGTDSIVACGSYTGNGSTTGPTVTLGWEPQWLMIKRTDAAYDWWFTDNMRGMVVGSNDKSFLANTSNIEQTFDWLSPTATGFQLTTSNINFNASGGTYIYLAIRRGPMKTPTDATKVFYTEVSTSATNTPVNAGWPADISIIKSKSSGTSFVFYRLANNYNLVAETAAAETLNANIRWDIQNGMMYPSQAANYTDWLLRRSPGFFDIVCYTGTGSATTVAHNLGVAPEMIIVKQRDATRNWIVYNSTIGNTKYLTLNTTGAPLTGSPSSIVWNDTSPSSTSFTVGTTALNNGNGNTYVAYLFATLAGVSKVGSYTGTGTTKQIDCGFTNGSRFVLIKRTDDVGDWYSWDSARGIVTGNDPYFLLNSATAEVTNTDYIDPYSAGFELSSTAPAAINANGGTYIFLAIA